MIRDAARCLRAHWPEKAAWSMALTLGFCAPYFLLQRVAWLPARSFPLSTVDRAIDFTPSWAWIYQSGYLLISAVPWLLDARDDLHRYIRGFTWISLVGFAFFLLLPVAGPRPAEVPGTGMYGVLVSYDDVTNAFPSLHVALLAFSIFVAARALGGRVPAARQTAILSAAAAWALAVAYATLATKQHYAVDLPAGLLLAWVVHRRLP